MSKKFATSDARQAGDVLGLDWHKLRFTPAELARGMTVELEHGRVNADTDVTGDDPTATAKIALAHRSSRQYRPHQYPAKC